MRLSESLSKKMIWAGLFLMDQRVRDLIPFKR